MGRLISEGELRGSDWGLESVRMRSGWRKGKHIKQSELVQDSMCIVSVFVQIRAKLHNMLTAKYSLNEIILWSQNTLLWVSPCRIKGRSFFTIAAIVNPNVQDIWWISAGPVLSLLHWCCPHHRDRFNVLPQLSKWVSLFLFSSHPSATLITAKALHSRHTRHFYRSVHPLACSSAHLW